MQKVFETSNTVQGEGGSTWITFSSPETQSVPNVLTRIVESRKMCVVSILFNLKIEFSDLKSKMDVKMAVIVITIDLVLSSGFTSVYEPVNFSMFHLLLLFSYRFYCVDVFVFFTLPLSLTGSYTKDELSSFKDVWFVYFNFVSATIKTTSKKTSCTTRTYSPNRRLELT